LLAGGRMTAYRSGSTYNVGSLPVWLWPEWWMQDQPAAVIVVMILGAAAIGICLYRMLRWRASHRTARSRSGVA